MSLIDQFQTSSVARGSLPSINLNGSSAIRDASRSQPKQVVVQGKAIKTVSRSVPEAAGFEERVFNSLVSLKVAVSQYAMHLSTEERQRLFGELDSVINTEDWHEEDQLPAIDSFRDFLKWMIYSKYNKWISIGVSDDGLLQVAWKTTGVLLTALFAGKEFVRWTAQIAAENGEKGYTVGRAPLRLFTKQAMFYLKGAEVAAGQN
jgi:hypothetical protein